MTASAAVIFVFVLTFATSVMARPPVPSTYNFDEYTDNNILGSMPDESDDLNVFKPEREEILEM